MGLGAGKGEKVHHTPSRESSAGLRTKEGSIRQASQTRARTALPALLLVSVPDPPRPGALREKPSLPFQLPARASSASLRPRADRELGPGKKEALIPPPRPPPPLGNMDFRKPTVSAIIQPQSGITVFLATQRVGSSSRQKASFPSTARGRTRR